MLKKSLIILSILTIASAAYCEQQKVTLKQTFKPGTYVLTQNQNMQQTTIMGEAGSFSQNVNMLMVMEMVISEPDENGSKKMTTTFKRIVQSITGGPVNMSYDSAEPDEGFNPMASIYEKMLETEISAAVDPEGNLVEVSGISEMFDKMGAEFPDSAPMMEAMKKQFNDEMMKEMIDYSKKFLPTKPVGVGDSWVAASKMNFPMLGEMDIKQNCKLKDIEKTSSGKLALIDFKGTMKTEEGGSFEMQPGMKMEFKKMEMTQDGVMKYDLVLGMMTQLNANQKSNMVLVMPDVAGDEESAEKMTMVVKQEGVMNMTIKPGKYVPPVIKEPASQPAYDEDQGL